MVCRVFPWFVGQLDGIGHGEALENAWQILTDGSVSTEAGTCIVHQAPAFGEDDNRVCLNAGIILKAFHLGRLG